MVQVRESSRFGFCYALGELIGETPPGTSIATGPAPLTSAKAHRSTSPPARGAWTIESARGGLNPPARGRTRAPGAISRSARKMRSSC